ncbi:DUF6879 family protein [Pseudonocardia acaciae]|uniref:DUF6879 family protein n=1 Tax=Pseudonocardia acaciae TaxID=551276 RepID=UPI000564E89B|nr:DUF6879 family protein [Pseudonocardia acaciae]
MDADELGGFIDQRFRLPGDRLFRMEVLPAYEVDSDGDDYRRWLDGATEPTWSRKQPWLDSLRRERDNGQVSTRVRVLSDELTTYERYACEFGYVHNASAGEDIRVLHRGEHALPHELQEEDFWVINDDIVVPMRYDQHGRFESAYVAEHDEVATYVRARDVAWAAAEPFLAWWARHPELHRRTAQAQ